MGHSGKLPLRLPRVRPTRVAATPLVSRDRPDIQFFDVPSRETLENRNVSDPAIIDHMRNQSFTGREGFPRHLLDLSVVLLFFSLLFSSFLCLDLDLDLDLNLLKDLVRA